MSDETGPARREEALRLSGTVAANKIMAAELRRLVQRSPFRIRVPEPRRQGSTALRYPFDPALAWVAACYHRSSSRIGWELASSPATRLEPLHADLTALLAADERLPVRSPLRFSVEIREVADFEAGPLQVRGAVKSAIEDALAKRGGQAVVDAEAPELSFQVRRTGREGERRTLLQLDLGGGARHRRGQRVAQGVAPLRETLAAQLVLLSRWDPRGEVLVDPMAGSGTIAIEAARIARGMPVRQPPRTAMAMLPAVFGELPDEAPPLYPDTQPRILASDVDEANIPLMIGNLRASGLTGEAAERAIVVRSLDVRELTPELLDSILPCASDPTGVFAFNPPYGQRMAAEGTEIVDLYAAAGRALGRFTGWRAAVIVANPRFKRAFGHRPAQARPATVAGLTAELLLLDL